MHTVFAGPMWRSQPPIGWHKQVSYVHVSWLTIVSCAPDCRAHLVQAASSQQPAHGLSACSSDSRTLAGLPGCLAQGRWWDTSTEARQQLSLGSAKSEQQTS